MTDDFPEVRSQHPFLMYDMLLKIPESILSANKQFSDFRDERISGPLYLTGIGTSFHALYSAAYPFHNKAIFAVQSYELEHYWEPSGSIIALSHTGKTKTTVDAIARHKKDNYTVGISHFADSPLLKMTDRAIPIDQPPDLSLCNTKSFFAGSFAVYTVLHNLFETGLSPQKIYTSFSNDFRNMEKQVNDLVQDLSIPNRIFVLGAGPNLAAARELAQKLKEATHIHAEGIELEEFNHGCTSVIDEHSLLVILSSDKVEQRVQRIVSACRIIGTKTVTVNGHGDYELTTDPLTEDLSPYHNIALVYFLAYYLALKTGVNPDMLRMEDKRYREFDSVIFPPGEH